MEAMTVHPTLPQPATKHGTETNIMIQAYTSMVFAKAIWKNHSECVCVTLLNVTPKPSAASCMQSAQAGSRNEQHVARASVVVSSLWLSLSVSQAPSLMDFGNSLPPSGLLELHERAGVEVGTT